MTRVAIRAANRRQDSKDRIIVYLADEVMPIPAFKHKAIKKSKKFHVEIIKIVLNKFDALMDTDDKQTEQIRSQENKIVASHRRY